MNLLHDHHEQADGSSLSSFSDQIFPPLPEKEPSLAAARWSSQTGEAVRALHSIFLLEAFPSPHCSQRAALHIQHQTLEQSHWYLRSDVSSGHTGTTAEPGVDLSVSLLICTVHTTHPGCILTTEPPEPLVQHQKRRESVRHQCLTHHC